MNPGALDGEVMHAGGGPQRIRNAVQLDGDAGPGEMSQPEQRAGLDDRADLMMLTRSHSASISDRMWLDSSTVRPRPLGVDAVLEHGLHQWVEPGGRFVHDQQFDIGGQRGDDGNLLPVALE